MKKLILSIFIGLLALSVSLSGYLFAPEYVSAKVGNNANVGVCPDGDGWTKIESSTFYPVAGAYEYCFKAGPYLTYADEMPYGGFGQPGACSADNKQGCALSHWSFHVPSCLDTQDLNLIDENLGGPHQIVGEDTQREVGDDWVYSLNDTDYLQCFCGPDGEGIQTYWWRTELESLFGWFSENGSQWHLGDYHYLAQNTLYDCSN